MVGFVGVFFTLFTRRQFLWLPVWLFCTPNPSEKGSILKGRNLPPFKHLFRRDVKQLWQLPTHPPSRKCRSICFKLKLLIFSFSAVAIPEVLNTCETKHGVNPNISRFFVPFATALNRTGSCIFITMSGLLLCQLEGLQLEGVKVLFLAYVILRS